MDKYFLMGNDGIEAFKRRSARGLLDSKDNYAIIKINTLTTSIAEIMDKTIGWDAYLEISYNDVEDIEIAKNRRNWMEFFRMIDPDGDMTATGMVHYLTEYYKVPEMINVKEL